jgi:hypothetical protein
VNYFQRSGTTFDRSYWGRGYGSRAMAPPAMAYPSGGGYGSGYGAGGGGYVGAPSIADVTHFITDGLIRPVTDGIRQAAANFSDTIGGISGQGAMGPRGGQYWGWQGGLQAPGTCGKCGGRGCEECCWPCAPCDPCHCRCCISDADLLIYSRLGERRVVPLRIENRWRRERDIKLELSGWTTHGGKAGPITAALEPPGSTFKLGPCAVRFVTLVVETPPGERGEGDRLIDVDDCVVYYADLRVEGCDIRPIRIALALLPRDCRAYDIACRCSCCC